MPFPFIAAAIGASGVIDAITGNSNAQQARDAFKSRYQDTVRDMKKAGLNPALAYGQGGGNPTTHDRPLPGEQMVKAGQGIASAAQARANADLTESQAKLLKAQTVDLIDQIRLRNAQIATETSATEATRNLTEQQAQEVRRRIHGLNLDNAFKSATLQNRVEMIAQELKEQGIDIRSKNIEQVIRRLAIPEAQALANYWRSMYGKASPYLNSAGDLVKSLMPRLNLNTGDKTINLPRKGP